MPVFAYLDPGTTGLIAQFAAAGIAGVLVYFRSRFGRRGKAAQDNATPREDKPAEERA